MVSKSSKIEVLMKFNLTFAFTIKIEVAHVRGGTCPIIKIILAINKNDLYLLTYSKCY